jgi:uncharacterized membrane protein YeaQ/YmgE (transglycosylase-associated protein family)
MGLLLILIIGGIVGWLASVLVQGGGMGVLADIIVGIIGAFLGGLIFGALGLGGGDLTSLSLYSFFVALVGAVVLLVIVRLVTGRRSTTTV